MRGSPEKQNPLPPPPGRERFRPKEWAVIQRCRTPEQVQAFLRALPPRFHTQQWLMAFAAGAVLVGLGLLYIVVSLVARVL